MSEPREFDFIPLKRAARYLVEKPKAVLRFRRQQHVDKITVFMDSDFSGDPVSRKSTMGLVAQIGNHTEKSGSTLQSLTSLSVGEAEFFAAVKGSQVDSERESAGETEKYSMDRLEAIHQREFKDARYFWIPEPVRTSSILLRRHQYQERKELRKYWKEANHCFRTAMLFELQDWCSTRPWIPHFTTR